MYHMQHVRKTWKESGITMEKDAILNLLRTRQVVDVTATNGVDLLLAVEQAKQRGIAWACSDLLPGGSLSCALPGYQHREAQIEMAKHVGHAITDKNNLLVEAATGTGKSLGYLIPVVRSGKTTVVSTANKALQDQIFKKDIPFVQQHVKQFEAAILKGRANYVCIDRLSKVAQEEKGDVWDADYKQLRARVENDTAYDGDFEALDFAIHPELKSKVYADKDQCAWEKCNFYSQCYVKRMKERVQGAQVIVTNHNLLLLDADSERILPAHEVTVVDEAHHLERIAIDVRTTEVKPSRVTSLLRLKQVKKHSLEGTYLEVERQFTVTWELLETIFKKSSKYGSGVPLMHPIEEGLHLASLLDTMAGEIDRSRPGGMTEKEEKLYTLLVDRTRHVAEDMRKVFSVEHKGMYVYHIENDTDVRNGGFSVRVDMTPLDVASFLKERLFDKYTVICASATLATAKTIAHNVQLDFSYLRKSVGEDNPYTVEKVLPAVFDYKKHALLYVPEKFPVPVYGDNPVSHEYEQAIASEMLRLVRASRGRAFLLFSSKRMLELVYSRVALDIPYPVLRQGDMPTNELVRRFKNAGNAVLFGVKSFWEGVDIAGDALSLVVIDKLPFNPPNDPVGQARVEAMKVTGENWWGEYVLPQVILHLKQGVGRLIRTETDKGVMAILDARLYTKSYGRDVVASLPPARYTHHFRDVEQFFS